MASDIKVPRLSENADTVQVTEVLVKAGDKVDKDQALIVVNADKSSADIRAPMAGTLVKLNVKVGDEIKVGSVYATIEGANGAVSAPAASGNTQKAKAEPAEKARPAE